MVSPCSGGGPAAPIPGSGTTVVFTAAAIESTLILLGLEEVAAVLAPVLAGTVYNLTSLCNSDPPADPGLTGADVLAAINFTDPVAQDAARTLVDQWFQHWYWYKACLCVSGATPAPPALSNPGNPQSSNTGLPYASLASTCWNVSQHFALPATGGTGTYVNVSAQMLPQTQSHVVTESVFVGTTTGWVVPTGITSVTITVDVPETESFANTGFFVSFYNAAGANIAYEFVQRAVSTGLNTEFHTLTFTIPALAVYWAAVTEAADTVAHNITASVSFLCTGGSSVLQQACCPPDPALSQQVTQILQMVTLLQRQLSPFSYILGTAHTGLSGNGTIAVQGLLGLKVDLTTTPSRLGTESGDPVELFGAGWVNVGTADGFSPRQFITSDPMVVLGVSPAATLIGYSIPADVTVTITELVREP